MLGLDRNRCFFLEIGLIFQSLVMVPTIIIDVYITCRISSYSTLVDNDRRLQLLLTFSRQLDRVIVRPFQDSKTLSNESFQIQIADVGNDTMRRCHPHSSV